MQRDVDKLDVDAPPPGYVVEAVIDEDGVLYWRARCGVAYLDGRSGEAEALTDAWTHYKARHDPPGMHVRQWGCRCHGLWTTKLQYLWTTEFQYLNEPRPGPRTVLLNDDSSMWNDQAAARAAAWAWYERRLALAARLHATLRVATETFRGRLLRTTILASEAQFFDDGEVETCDAWPRCLTWSDDQVAAVQRWLVDSTAELPEVLRG